MKKQFELRLRVEINHDLSIKAILVLSEKGQVFATKPLSVAWAQKYAMQGVPFEAGLFSMTVGEKTFYFDGIEKETVLEGKSKISPPWEMEYFEALGL